LQLRLAAIAAGTLLLAGCGGGGSGSSGTTTSSASASAGCSDVPPPTFRKVPGKRPPPTARLDAGKTYTVEVKTNCGAFTITLEQKTSPKAAASFFELAKQNFYDGVVFHRIVPSFVVQGGDPSGTGRGGPGYTTVDKPPRKTRYTRGVVAMAKTASDPRGTAGSQFFIVTPPQIQLDPDYAVIGRVTKGLDVVLRIGTYGDSSGTPLKRVVIEDMVTATS
jgi:peptidyl-prolyl cis-trans isomerase B (cyclophilin B)